MRWVEHFQIQRIHVLRSDGQLQEAAKELADYGTQV